MKKPIYARWWFMIIVAVFVVLLIATPFIINEYNDALWDASDMLAFYGAALSFIGSTVLGIVAFAQNEKIRQFSLQVFEMEHKHKSMPNFLINEVSFVSNGSLIDKVVARYKDVIPEKIDGEWVCCVNTFNEEDADMELYFSISLKNIGEGMAQNIKVIDIGNGILDAIHHYRVIADEVQTLQIFINIPMMTANSKEHHLILITYENIYGFKNSQALTIDAEHIEGYKAKFTIKDVKEIF